MKGPLPGQVERTDTSSSSSSSATAVSNTSYLFPPATAPSVPMPTVSRPASPTLAPSNPPQASGAPSYDGAPEDSASTEHFTRLMRVETVMLSEPPPPFSEFFEVEDEPAPAPYTPHELESVREDVLEAPPPAHNELAAYTTLPRNAHADEAPAPYTTLPRASQADEAPAPYTSLPRTSHVDEAPAVYTTLPRDMPMKAPAAYTTLPRDTATDVNNVPSAHQDSPAVYDSPPQEGGSNGPPAFTAIPEQEEEPEMIWELCNVQEVAVGRYEPATDGEINVEIGDIVFVRSAWVDG
ncbi:hypothetical protein BC829DRAFT_3168 [Chytridium lagenaria]|nr:hypothetical protein BC829DRAFT_3168 [Chytridium lagenaria]